MLVVIDADQLVYSVGFATEGEPLRNSFHTVNQAINRIVEGTGASEYQVYIGGKDNFREEVAMTLGYKATRPSRKPSSYNDIRQFLIDNHSAEVVNGMEADDKVSILLYEDFIKTGGDPEKAGVVLSSPDKDLNNTPGWHWNPMRSTLRWITELQADRHFLYQLLTGDRTDNIKGLPFLPKAFISELNSRGVNVSGQAARGLGKGTAKTLLSNTTYDEAVEIVLECYIAWGDSRGLDLSTIMQYLEEQAILLWMIREVTPSGKPVMFKIPEEWNERATAIYTERTGFSGGSGLPERTGHTGGGTEESHEAASTGTLRVSPKGSDRGSATDTGNARPGKGDDNTQQHDSSVHVHNDADSISDDAE